MPSAARRAGEFTKATCYTTPLDVVGAAIARRDARQFSIHDRAARGRQALIWALKIVVSGGLLYPAASGASDLGRAVDGRARTRRSPGWPSRWRSTSSMMLISAWRWGLLLARAAHRRSPFGTLLNSYLVATFFNNFLPSNIGGDVIRIRDTAPARGLEDAGDDDRAGRPRHRPAGPDLRRGARRHGHGARSATRSGRSVRACCGRSWRRSWSSRSPAVLHAAGRRRAAAAAARAPPGVGRRAHRAADDGARASFATRRGRSAACFVGAILRAGRCSCSSTRPIARALHVNVPLAHLAIVVPMSFIVQMLPVSVERLRRARGDVRLLLHEARPAARVGARAVVHRRGADHALLDFRRRREPHPPPVVPGGGARELALRAVHERDLNGTPRDSATSCDVGFAIARKEPVSRCRRAARTDS